MILKMVKKDLSHGPCTGRVCSTHFSPLTGEGAFQLSPDHVAIHRSPDPVCGPGVLGYLANSSWDDQLISGFLFDDNPCLAPIADHSISVPDSNGQHPHRRDTRFSRPIGKL